MTMGEVVYVFVLADGEIVGKNHQRRARDARSFQLWSSIKARFNPTEQQRLFGLTIHADEHVLGLIDEAGIARELMCAKAAERQGSS
ncbi:MAG: hypothetical protein SFX73_27010 [Kofleriaceae bacterium]|nr:hypothetical protein [Kofleriaceae bacterium]